MPVASTSWSTRLTGPLAAIVLLAGFWAFLMASVSNKSLTADEIAHATAGYAYWKFDDYRFNPENGNLPQRVMGFPLWLGGTHFPPTDSEAWRTSDEWVFGYQWFHQMGNDVTEMLFRGRAAIALVTTLLGGLIWWWSRRLFGPWGALLSLLLFIFNPTVLANGALMTSDATATLFFLAAVAGIWAVLHRVTPARVVFGGLLVGGLFVSKMSAPLIIPIALALAAARVIHGQPLPVRIGRARDVTHRGAQLGVIALMALVQTLLTWGVVWSFFGFRYSAFADADRMQSHYAQKWDLVLDKPDPLSLVGHLGLSPTQNDQLAHLLDAARVPKDAWAQSRVDAVQAIREKILTPEQTSQLDRWLASPSPSLTGRLVDFAREHRLLPEAYLFGTAHTLKFSKVRSAFLNGEVRVNGWRSFFPYTFLVKTPLSFMVLLLLALAAAVTRWRQKNAVSLAGGSGAGFPPSTSLLYQSIPLWTLFGFYWAAVIFSHLNIGHRHILVTYPPLFIFAGVAADWLRGIVPMPGVTAVSGRARSLGWVVIGFVTLLAADIFYRFPNYIAYVNALAGGPANGYRHLVDSSFDWGQDLPAVKKYLERERPSGPVYLSYFGNASPHYYKIPAHYLYAYDSQDVVPPLKLLTRPLSTVQAEVESFLRQHPDYSVAGSAHAADNTALVLLLKDPAAFRLGGGLYLISATMLQPVLYNLAGPLGPWNPRFESTYQELSALVKPFLNDNPQVRLAALRSRRPAEWAEILQRFDTFRFARLTAWLRQRQPDGNINYSILLYRLTDADVAQALEGPPAELGADVPKEAEAQLADGLAIVPRSP